MHELAICQALMSQVEDVAMREQATCVTLVRVGIGPLSGVEAQLLAQAYTVASAGTLAEGASLAIDSLPVRVKCTQCDKESDATPNKLTCRHCGDWRTTLVSGDEMMLMQVELERATQEELLDEPLEEPHDEPLAAQNKAVQQQ